MSSQLNIHYEDEHLLVVDKPGGVLSQPGKTMDGSIATQIHDAYPKVTGPMLVHRLDMDTSGLMVFAKSRAVHRDLQQQFERRKIIKRYTAVLSRLPIGAGGHILLPLRLDIDNRPVQIVCFKHGKPASTLWKLANRPYDEHGSSAESSQHTRVTFMPLSGRTHQLRLHAAHPNGLNAPIVGDRLYGDEGQRLMLHANLIGFTHPLTGKQVVVTSTEPF